MTSVYVRIAFGEPVSVATPYDAVEDFYFVRDVDTVPGILHAEELFGRVKDARHGLARRRQTRRSTEEASTWRA